jgi:hypothetical protein
MLAPQRSYHSGDVSDEARKGKFKQSQIEPDEAGPVPQARGTLFLMTGTGGSTIALAWSVCPSKRFLITAVATRATSSHGIPIVDKPSVSATGALSNPMTAGAAI